MEKNIKTVTARAMIVPPQKMRVPQPQTEETDYLKNFLSEYASRLEKMEGKVPLLEEKLTETQNTQIKTIEALGIFTALFTFISVNIQIFRNIIDIKTATLFMVAMAGLTLFILSAVHLIIHSQTSSSGDNVNWWIKFIAITLCGAFLISIGLSSDIKLNPKEEKNNNQNMECKK